MTDHIIIDSDTSWVRYAIPAYSSQRDFDIPFSFFEEGDIRAALGTAVLNPAEYTVTGIAASTGYSKGTLKLANAAPGQFLLIERYTPRLRTTDLAAAGLDPNDINDGFDRLHAIEQEQDAATATKLTPPSGQGILTMAGGKPYLIQASDLARPSISQDEPDRYEFVASVADQTEISGPDRHGRTLRYRPGISWTRVYVNGVLLPSVEYTAFDGLTIINFPPMNAGDEITVDTVNSVDSIIYGEVRDLGSVDGIATWQLDMGTVDGPAVAFYDMGAL